MPDPTNPQSLNRYSYCYNNPVNIIDPTGHTGIGIGQDLGDPIGMGHGEPGSPYDSHDGSKPIDIEKELGIPKAEPYQTLSSVNVWGQWLQRQASVNNISIVDLLHLSLDLGGLLPGVGESFDLINAGIYAVRGDKVNAGLSAVSAIPFFGLGGTITKVGNKTKEIITIIGARADTLKYVGKKGFDVLNIKNWTPKKNIEWLQKAMRKVFKGEGKIKMVTDPLKHQDLMNDLGKASTFTNLELPHLLDNNFITKGKDIIFKK